MLFRKANETIYNLNQPKSAQFVREVTTLGLVSDMFLFHYDWVWIYQHATKVRFSLANIQLNQSKLDH